MLTEDGTFFELSSTTAQVSSLVQTNVPSGGDWAVMVYGTEIYFFTDDGTVSRYDPPTNQVTVEGMLAVPVVGASAAPCVP